MINTLSERIAASLPESRDPIEACVAWRNIVQGLAKQEQAELRSLLIQSSPDSSPYTALGKQQILQFLDLAERMSDEVEREGRQVVVADMPHLSPEKQSYGLVRKCALSEKGWPLDAELIVLDGELQAQRGLAPVVYYIQEGNPNLTIPAEGIDRRLQSGEQAAIPRGTTHALSGTGWIYALRCRPELGGPLSIENFNDDAKRNKCPCGWSYRIPLANQGWGFSTHRTVMHDMHEPAHDGFEGHQHKRTHEIYFTDEVNEENATISIDGVSIPLKRGTLVAIPNGTMHAVKSQGRIVQHIFVGGGHKNDDFWTAGWQPLPR